MSKNIFSKVRKVNILNSKGENLVEKVLTYSEFISLAKGYYQEGGITFVEFWDEDRFKQYTSIFGDIFYKDALNVFDEELTSIYAFIASNKGYRH